MLVGVLPEYNLFDPENFHAGDHAELVPVGGHRPGAAGKRGDDAAAAAGVPGETRPRTLADTGALSRTLARETHAFYSSLWRSRCEVIPTGMRVARVTAERLH